MGRKHRHGYDILKISKRIAVAIILILTLRSIGATTTALAASGACATPAVNYGKDTTALVIQTAGTYRVWSHLRVPSAAARSFLLQVDSSQCFLVETGSSAKLNTWTWIDYTNGDPTQPIDLTNLAVGSHTLTLLGAAPGVALDDILLTSDTSCVPVGAGDNCNASSTGVSPAPASSSPAAGVTNAKPGGQPAGTNVKRSISSQSKRGGLDWPAVVVGVIVLMAGGGSWYLWRKRRSRL
jgi:hypothetical protein